MERVSAILLALQMACDVLTAR